MDTIVINSENSKTSDSHRILNLTDKINFKRSDKYVDLSNRSIYHTHGKKSKKSNRINRLKISALTWNDKLDFLMDHILHQLFKIISGISLKSMKH